MYVNTNCGQLTPQIFKSCKLDGSPSTMQGHIPYFNKMLCQWAYSVPMKFSWVMLIIAHNRDYLINKIKTVVPNYEPPGWNMDNTTDVTWTNATQDVVGCIFAQGVDIPGENINIDYAGVSEGSNRGFINAPIVNGRSNFEPLNAGFLETNKSFTDGVLRPWSILVAHEGLIATPRNKSIKADILIYQLAKNGECSPNIIRKAYVFHDCVPINIQKEQLDYNNSGDFPKMQASFVYNNYYIDDFNSNGYYHSNNNSNSSLRLSSKNNNTPILNNRPLMPEEEERRLLNIRYDRNNLPDQPGDLPASVEREIIFGRR